MRLTLLFAFLALPLLEIALLIKAGHKLGVWGVLLLIVATAVLGIVAIRQHGFTMARRMAEAIERGQPPGGAVLEGALVVMAGTLLVAPGLITDALGLFLLIPPLRRLVARWATNLLFCDLAANVGTSALGGEGTVIDGEFERLDESTTGTSRGSKRSLTR